MRYITIIFLFIFIFITSCNNSVDNQNVYSLRDSVTREHLKRIDSAFYFDTADVNYKVLKAYITNDTAFFTQLYVDIERERKYRQQLEISDSCIHQPSLKDLNVEESYRFVYTAAFCDYKLNVTVSKYGDSANIHFIIFKDLWLNDTCKIVNEYNKKITKKNWDDFSRLMDKADFWGLKSTNGVHGFDGSTLVVTGFSNGYRSLDGKARFNYVNRWGYSTLSEPFDLVLKLSGNRQGCIVIR